jgi:hypothetical protein
VQVLAAGRNLKVWGGDPGAAPTYDCMIAQDKEVVKMVLLLAGSIEGTKHGIREYVSTFEQYSFLWQRDLQTEYAAFMATHPSLEVRSICQTRPLLLPIFQFSLCAADAHACVHARARACLCVRARGGREIDRLGEVGTEMGQGMARREGKRGREKKGRKEGGITSRTSHSEGRGGRRGMGDRDIVRSLKCIFFPVLCPMLQRVWIQLRRG